MSKKPLCLVCAFVLVFAFMPLPAALAEPWYGTDDDGNTTYETSYFEDGETYKLALGASLKIPEGYTLTFSNPEVASFDAATGAIKGLAAGTTTVTYAKQGDSDDWRGDEPADSGSFMLEVVSLGELQGASYRVTMGDATGSVAELQVPVKELAADDTDAVTLLGEPDGVYLDGIADGHITLGFYEAGTYHLELGIFGGTVKITVRVVELSLNESVLVLYKGKAATVKVKNAKRASFESDNSLVATVSKSGKVKAKQVGNCTLTVKADAVTLACSVGVTSKKAYGAVQNAKFDLKKKYKYSQAKRMSKNYRDCSSFVSRCYWDNGLKRKICAIGGSTGKTWALPAADQAKWLNKKGKRIAYKAISAEQLLPGDTIYYQTGYAGTNNRYRHIDHAAIYVGGGLALNTGGWGGTGTVGYCYYDSGCVRFIGRPISSFVLNKSSVTLKKGKTSKLKALFAKGKLSYKSSKPDVASVSKAGKLTAKAAGTCTVTAKCKAGTYRCKVVVE